MEDEYDGKEKGTEEREKAGGTDPGQRHKRLKLIQCCYCGCSRH